MSNNDNIIFENVIRRLGKYIQKNISNGCWEWTGSKTKDGYGKSWFRGKTIRAHRLSFLSHKKEEIPEGYLILHKCDNPICINPDHLFCGTPSENTIDMYKKGRGVNNRGENCGTSKLNKKEIEEIKKQWLSGESQGIIAKRYKITQSNVSRIVNEKTWKK